MRKRMRKMGRMRRRKTMSRKTRRTTTSFLAGSQQKHSQEYNFIHLLDEGDGPLLVVGRTGVFDGVVARP